MPPPAVVAPADEAGADARFVLDLMDRLPPGPLAKEDGSPLIDGEGKRVA